MKAFLLVALATLATCALALPTPSKLSQEELRASLITKDNIAEYLQSQRRKKAILQVPEPFVISTSLNVGRPARQSRTYFDEDGTAVIEGVRMPDDPEKDKVTWRNGRVINNVFVPANAVVPEPVNVRQPKEIVMITGSSMQQPQLSRQPKQFDFDDFYKGREPQHLDCRGHDVPVVFLDAVATLLPVKVPQKLQPQAQPAQDEVDQGVPQVGGQGNDSRLDV
jgi:hypothetical protein